MSYVRADSNSSADLRRSKNFATFSESQLSDLLGDDDQGAQPLRSETIDVNELLEALPRQLTHGQLARLLWMEDYWPVFVLTLGQFADVSEPLAEIFMGVRGLRRADVDRATVMRLVSSVVSVVQGEESKRPRA